MDSMLVKEEINREIRKHFPWVKMKAYYIKICGMHVKEYLEGYL